MPSLHKRLLRGDTQCQSTIPSQHINLAVATLPLYISTAIAQSQGFAVDKTLNRQGQYYQQDYGFAGLLPQPLSAKDLEGAARAAARAARHRLDGSTLSLAALNANGDLHVANIADSPIFAFVITADKKVTSHYLIRDAHDAAASPRAQNGKIPFAESRAQGLISQADPLAWRQRQALHDAYYPISIARALGDWLYELPATPDINSYDFNQYLFAAGADGAVLLCTASDGICPPYYVTNDYEQRPRQDAAWGEYYAGLLQDALQKNGRLTAAEMGNIIAAAALAQRQRQTEKDNLLLMATLFPGSCDTRNNVHHKRLPLRRLSGRSLVHAICDGHRPAGLQPTLEAADMNGECAVQSIKQIDTALRDAGDGRADVAEQFRQAPKIYGAPLPMMTF